jgi:predicted lipoprotein
MKLLLPLAFGVAAFAGAAHAENAAIVRAINGYVLPAYIDFHTAATTMRVGMGELCDAPAPDRLASAQAEFLTLVTAWSGAELLRFGPVAVENRLERILFWPDRKSIGLKQVQAALAQKDPTATDPVTLAGKSVAMQGLGALEFVLFGTGNEALGEAGEGYRCAYGRAIAENVEQIAAAVLAGWQAPDGIAKAWANPAADNALYRTDQEAMTELLDVFVHGTELVRDVRIGGFLGETADDDKPKQAIFWRSGGTVASIAGDLGGARKLFETVDFAQLLPADSAWIAQSTDFEFGNADRALAALSGPPADLLSERESREKLAYVRLVTSSLSELFGTRLAPALGLTAGFSSLDGD